MKHAILRFGFISAAVLFVVFVIAFVTLPLPGHVPLLMYHFIDTHERAENEKNVVSEQSFERQMLFLKKFRYHVISLDDYYEIKMGLRQPRGREVVITFDDGNYTFHDKAFPILSRFGFPVSVFVVSENIRQRLHGSMTKETIVDLLQSGQVTLGSHTRTHALLSTLDENALIDEIQGSKQAIESMFSIPVHYFAYPSGGFNDQVINIVRDAGYRLAFTTTQKKLGDLGNNPFTLTRVKISKTSDSPFGFWVKISGIYDAVKRLRHQFKSR